MSAGGAGAAAPGSTGTSSWRNFGVRRRRGCRRRVRPGPQPVETLSCCRRLEFGGPEPDGRLGGSASSTGVAGRPDAPSASARPRRRSLDRLRHDRFRDCRRFDPGGLRRRGWSRSQAQPRALLRLVLSGFRLVSTVGRPGGRRLARWVPRRDRRGLLARRRAAPRRRTGSFDDRLGRRGLAPAGGVTRDARPVSATSRARRNRAPTRTARPAPRRAPGEHLPQPVGLGNGDIAETSAASGSPRAGRCRPVSNSQAIAAIEKMSARWSHARPASRSGAA